MVCPSCRGRLVDRIYGAWCPRCRGWIILAPHTRWEQGELGGHYAKTYVWTVGVPRND